MRQQAITCANVDSDLHHHHMGVTRPQLIETIFILFFLSLGPLKKIIWTLITFGCLGLLTYNMYYLFNDYLHFPVNVNVEIKSKNKLSFPAVTICNVNPVR